MNAQVLHYLNVHASLKACSIAPFFDRNPLKACEELGIEPRFDVLEGDINDAAAYVESANLMRRDLTTGQRALAGVKIKKVLAVEAHKRKAAGVKADLQNNCSEGSQSRDIAAKRVGLSGLSITRAEAVLAKAQPAVVQLLEQGDMSLNEAFEIAALPKATQEKVAVGIAKRTRSFGRGDHNEADPPAIRMWTLAANREGRDAPTRAPALQEQVESRKETT